MFISYDKNYIIRAVSSSNIKAKNTYTIETNDVKSTNIIGKKLILGKNTQSKLKVAIICNWRDKCGIATYTTNLVNNLKQKGQIEEIKLFAEIIPDVDEELDRRENVSRCWKRGTSMVPCVEEILQWNPDIVLVQHEFGLFPKATHFLKLLEMLDNLPYVVTLHSVYEHLDKTICTAYIRNMIVHSNDAKDSLHRNGHLNNIDVILHGCIEYEDNSELWNIFQNDYAIIQFGFGFDYKGVDIAIDAINHLKQTQNHKFKDIFYCYMCTESPHTRFLQQEYYNYLKEKVDNYNLQENVVIVRGFLSDKYISNFLRTAKLAIFPYKNNKDNIVYGASGAIRNAMASGIPIIASDCHLFDDLNNVVPRISNYLDLAQEIDKIFSNQKYRKNIIDKSLKFVKNNTWNIVADQYVNVFQKIVTNFQSEMIRVENFNLLEN